MLDGRRKVDDHRVGRRRAPRAGDRLADLERELELGVMEALGRVLEADAVAGEAAAHLRAPHGQLPSALVRGVHRPVVDPRRPDHWIGEIRTSSSTPIPSSVDASPRLIASASEDHASS